MAPNEQREIEEQMRALDDHALLRLLAIEASDYRPEALEIARGELQRRHLEILDKEQYWLKFPSERLGADGFCARCRSQTTDEPPWPTASRMFGMRLLGRGDECLVCGSILQTLWFCFWVPIIPVGQFRVVYQMGDSLFPTGYIGRKLIS